MESLVLNPMSANQDFIPNLTAVSPSLPCQEYTFNPSTWNYLVSTGEDSLFPFGG